MSWFACDAFELWFAVSLPSLFPTEWRRVKYLTRLHSVGNRDGNDTANHNSNASQANQDITSYRDPAFGCLGSLRRPLCRTFSQRNDDCSRQFPVMEPQCNLSSDIGYCPPGYRKPIQLFNTRRA